MNLKLKLLPLFLLFFFSLHFTNAQLTFEKRVEFQKDEGQVNQRIFEFGTSGLVMLSRSEKSDNGKYEWRFDLLDTDLNIKAFTSVFLDKEFTINESYSSTEHIHLLFSSKKLMKLLTLNIQDLEEQIVEFELPKKVYINEMKIVGDIAVFAAQLKSAPYLFSIEWQSGQMNYIPLKGISLKANRVNISDLQVLEDSNEIIVYVKSFIRKATDKTAIIRLNTFGRIIETFNFSEDLEKNIIYLSATKLSEDRFIFTGTYSEGESQISSGLFFAEKNKDAVVNIKYHSFLELKDFLSYLPEKSQEKLEKKKKRKEKSGKTMTLNYRIAMHDAIRLEDGFVFIGEAYYPTYRTETRTTYINGRPTTTTEQVFDGYFYTHAVVCKFDFDGNIVWDRTFTLKPEFKPFYPKLFISVLEEDDNSMDMVFVNRSSIVFKSLSYDGDVLLERSSESMETMNKSDQITYSNSDVLYWYDRNFITSGNQKIKNKEDENVKNKRQVFFISKISYNPTN